MTTNVFIILISSLVLGVLLITAGRRGFRINRHPVCRDCRFDLEGIYPAQTTCPECGRGLGAKRAVRIGSRRPVRSLMVAGALLVLVPGAPLGILAYAAATGTDLNKHKPLWLLTWEGPRAGAEQGEAIADELLMRLKTASLPAAAVHRMVECALSVQADDSAAWSETWGDIVEYGSTTPSGLAEGQYEQFLLNAARLGLEVRPRVRIGDVLPINVKVTEARVGSGTRGFALVWIKEITLDGANASLEPEQSPQEGWITREGAPIQWMSVRSRPRLQGASSPINETSLWPVVLPPMIASGVRNLQITVALKLSNPRSGSGDSHAPSDDDPEVHHFKLESLVNVVSEDMPTVVPLAPTPDAGGTLALTAAVPLAVLRIGSGDSAGVATLLCAFDVHPVGAPFAFDVFVRSGGQEHRAGSIASKSMAIPDYTPRRNAWGDGGDGSIVMAELRVPLTMIENRNEVDLVLRPNPDAVTRTIELTRYYDGDIVLERVPLQRTNR